MLKKQLDNDLTEALKSKNLQQAGTLRLLKARIKNEEIAAQKEFSDEEILPIISSEVKRRRDSIEAYTDGNRPELAANEALEIETLMRYMPAQFSEAEVSAIIDEALAGKNFTAADFGKAMGAVMPKLKGKADGAVVSKLLKEKLK